MTQRKEEYKVYLESPHWKALRGEALVRDGRKCTRCGSTVILQVHHMIYRTRFEDSLLSDLITLCKECHQAEHGLKRKIMRQKKVRVTGRVVVTDWKSLCQARSKHQISRVEFLKQKEIYRPSQRNHRSVFVQRRGERKRRWWPGMSEGKSMDEVRVEIGAVAAARYEPNF